MTRNYSFPYGVRESVQHCSFQQESALAHYAITVREFLSIVFRDSWIGGRSQQLLAPLDWVSQSPDLSSCDNALWEIVKQKVTQKWYRSVEDMID
jgi:hypothetical protein